jgi:hypothetical protein
MIDLKNGAHWAFFIGLAESGDEFGIMQVILERATGDVAAPWDRGPGLSFKKRIEKAASADDSFLIHHLTDSIQLMASTLQAEIVNDRPSRRHQARTIDKALVIAIASSIMHDQLEVALKLTRFVEEAYPRNAAFSASSSTVGMRIDTPYQTSLTECKRYLSNRVIADDHAHKITQTLQRFISRDRRHYA